LTRLDVVQLEGVVREAENEQRGHARREGKRVRELREGGERRVVLHCVEVEDVRPSVVVCRREPLPVRTYGHARDRGWRGHVGASGVNGLGIIDHDGFRVRLFGVLLRFGRRIYFAGFVVSSPSEGTSFDYWAPTSVLIEPANHPRGGRVRRKIEH
jgi:hypothetical protein